MTEDADKPRGERSGELDDTVAAAESLSADRTAPPLPATSREPTAAPRGESGQYLLNEEIARGGMGRIWWAHDKELGRDIAIKELLKSGPTLERRFQREVEITARLQHPGIISVHAAGRWPTGEAFFTMRKVDGRALDKAIAEKTALSGRLSLLPNVIAVADALAYAHSRGVIHRDLKPANVLVGAYGETVVIDWGLAKDLHRADDDDDAAVPKITGDEGLTVFGEAIGTPAYMSPRQAHGRAVDERADVYALGALLYHVLAGRRPYADVDAKSTEDLLETVKRRPPTPLAKLVPDAPPDLLAIVDKAMHRFADRRYANAGELAEDLKRFETGQLVGAHAYSLWSLLGRWIRKHRAAVAVAALMVVLLAAVGTVAVVRVTQEKHRAEAQRKEAVENRTEVEALLQFMLRDLHAKLQPIGKTELLDMVAKKASAYYGRRPVDWSRPEEARKRGAAHENLGEVRRARGDLDGALAEHRAAAAIRARLVEMEPENRVWLRDLSLSHDKIGYTLRAQGDLEAALVEFRAGMVIGERLAELSPDNADLQRDLSVGHDNIADVLKDKGDLEGALAEYRAGMEIAAGLLASAPENTERQRDVSVGHNHLGDTLLRLGRTAEAIAEYRKANAILEELVGKNAEHAEWSFGLVLNDLKLGSALEADEHPSSALDRYRAALAIVERLCELDPTNINWQRTLAVSHALLGKGLLQTGETARGREHLRLGAETYERVAIGADDFYNAACAYASFGKIDRAFAMLARAADHGYANTEHLRSEPALASLRADPRWESLMERMDAERPEPR